MNEYSFRPAWWLPGAHLQTIWPTFFRIPTKELSIKRERFELPDGDFLDIDWAGQGNGPIVIILHGLEGSIESPYARGMLAAIERKGWRGAFMHFRCCSGELNRLPRTYHSGETGDISIVVDALQKREPGVPFAAIGFSLGGNVLLKWLGETGRLNTLKAAVAISVPFDLDKSVECLNQGFSRLYQWHLLKELHRKMLWKFREQSAPIALPPLSALHSIRDFDENVTAPLHGFSCAEEYYAKSSSRQFLQTIRIPTLVVHAKDDPFLTGDFLPDEDELSRYIQLELTEKGGHVGFVSGRFPWSATYWLEERVPRFLREYL